MSNTLPHIHTRPYLQMFYIRKQQFFYRHLPQRVECSVDATPLPSNPVVTYNATNFELTRENRLSMSLSWDIPEVTYGEVQGFDYRITATPPDPFNVDTSDIDTVLPSDTIQVTIFLSS